MALIRMNSVKDYERAIKKNPSMIYNNNPDSVIKQNDIPWETAHDFLAAHIKYNKNLYYFASNESEKFHKNLTYLSIFIGWGINLFTIIVSSYENDVSKNLVTTLNSLGNLLSVIVITVVNFYSLQEQIFVFRRYAYDLDQLQSNIEFCSGVMIAERKTHKEIKDSYTDLNQKYVNLKASVTFPITKRTQDKFYNGIGFKPLYQVYEELFSSFSRKIISENSEEKEQNKIIIKEN